jgi:hypothetical protein
MENFVSHYNEIKLSAWKDIKKYTCQFLVKKRGEYHGYGSGVFIKVDDHHFLISAAHVLEANPLSLCVPLGIGNGGVTLQGEINTNKINGLRKDDRLDVGIFKLKEDTVSLLCNYYEFLTQNELGVNHLLEIKEQYLTYGFPTSQTLAKYKTTKVTSNPFCFSTWPKASDIYAEMNCKLNENIIIHFDKFGFIDTVTNKQRIVPDTYGMSGSGLWYVPNQIISPETPIKKKLVGILTEWYDQNKKVIIATRIDVISELIRQAYNLDLQKSNIYNTTCDIERIE